MHINKILIAMKMLINFEEYKCVATLLASPNTTMLYSPMPNKQIYILRNFNSNLMDQDSEEKCLTQQINISSQY